MNALLTYTLIVRGVVFTAVAGVIAHGLFGMFAHVARVLGGLQ